MKRMMVGVLATVGGCVAGGGGKDECRPLDQHCEGATLYDCSPDVELQRQYGETSYMWREVFVCEDDPILGPQTCVEQKLSSGRVEASCDVATSRTGAP
jgi:hypothetical protein